ncbi:stress-response A/B barrel domain-containing protein HS1 [Eucalyptus grandis]|uniref:Stress-response A/B barrel domain-containing protein n=3 Tax=Eucalyptus grandis TaxID=71139 RepID=A0A059D491_EUCGR|nr:stress-response A/B barrel domain-containing protein HS1 [Eucalyptus grandis]KAK3441958.1 hypothetical protein EUGRSUZ_B02218 [Eucalyptus grandis]KAK3441959.1 hypothetical protein EUGRSUZ_B02218 [Eucalyptus grandis]
MEEAKGLAKRVLLVKFKDGTPPARLEEILKNYANLVNLVEPLKSWRMGKNVSFMNLDQGFTHVFELTFESAKGLAEYADHPAHTEFSSQCRPYLDKFVVINYEPTVFCT